MAGAFVADVLLEETNEVLQVPVIKPRHAKKLLQGIAPRIPLLGNSSAPTTEDKLGEFLQHVGTLFGRDPTKWDKVGDTKTDITELDGKRIIRRTGMYTGTELHLFVSMPYYDPRLPPRPDQPHLEFSTKCKEISSTQEWQQLIADQPWNSSKRRQLLLSFLQAKMESEEQQLQLEGARGMWELSINKQHQAEMEACHLRLLVQHLESANIEVARTCAAAIWGLAVNERSRALLLELGVVQVLLKVASSSLTMPCVTIPDPKEIYTAGGIVCQAQRNQLQACVLGSLSVLVVDHACRRPIMALEPGLETFFTMATNLPGYKDRTWTAARREIAAKAITSLVQRDHEARMLLMTNGGIAKLLTLLDTTGPGHSKVQYCVATILAILVLDEAAMEAIQQRQESHMMFEATLKLLSHVMTALKFSLAVGETQIPSEGMTQAAAMQKLRLSGAGGSSTSIGIAPAAAVNQFQAAPRRQSQDTNGMPLSRRLSTDAAQAAAILQEASCLSATAGNVAVQPQASQLSQQSQLDAIEDDPDEPEPLDVPAAVLLAEACAQAVWGSAHHSLMEPTLHITQEHVIELGKLALDCLIISELDLGRVCHCLCATLASLASNEVTAAYIMAAPADSVAKAMLALLEVEDEENFSKAGHVRAAASTCLAFLACHPLGARGATCLTGPFRTRLLNVGAFGALLKAALAATSDDACDAIIQQTAAVGIMYMATMAGAVDPAELAMYAALMTSNTNVEMVEYLMAGMWILLKNSSNRQVLGGAFAVNPATSALTKNMMDKLQDTIEVADVNEAAEKLSKTRPITAVKKLAKERKSSDSQSTPRAEDSKPEQAAATANTTLPIAAPADAAVPATEPGTGLCDAELGGQNHADDAGTGEVKPQSTTADVQPDVDLIGRAQGAEAVAAAEKPRMSGAGLVPESSFGTMAMEADTMEDKLQLVQTKRRSVLFSSINGSEPCTPRSPHHSGTGISATAPEVGQGSRIEEISQALKEGPESKHTLETVKSMDRSLNRSLTNLDKQLGSQLDDNWGLDVLVRVGETWLPKLAEAQGVARGTSNQGVNPDVNASDEATKADVPLLKLFEFLTASLCLYVIEEEPASPLHKTANVYSNTKAQGAKKNSKNSWWTVAAPMIQADAELSPLLHRTMHILLTVLHLRLPSAWKILQLSVVMLWNAAVQSANVERHQVLQGICATLLDIINSRLWPPTLRDLASGHLQFLMETHDNLVHLGQEWQQQRIEQQQQLLQQQQAKKGSTPKASVSGSIVSNSSSGRNPGKSTLVALSATGHAAEAPIGVNNNPLPFNLQALLNPKVCTPGSPKRKQEPLTQQQPDPLSEAMVAAGAHVGLVPVLSAWVGLIKTGHPLLQHNGARGIARLCFAGSCGAPCMSQLLTEVKATASAVGGIGALIDLLRATATKFMVLSDGGTLPPPPVLTHLVDKEYTIYEREVNNAEGVLELLTVLLAAILNLSTLRSNQPKIAKRGIMVLLKSNTSLYQIISCRDAPTEAEMKLLDMLAAIIQNMASHPDNRTQMYRAELAGTAALDRVLEAPMSPASPEPVDTSTAVLASRLTGVAATATTHKDGADPPTALQQPERSASPTVATLPQLQQVCDGTGAPMLRSSLDSAISAAAVLRPKVVFPPISRNTVNAGPDMFSRSVSPSLGWPASPHSLAAASTATEELLKGLAGGCRPAALVPPRTATQGLRVGVGSSSAKSRAAGSLAGMPGSPTGAPDSREQFLIWMDSTFADVKDMHSSRAQSPLFGERRNDDMRTCRRPLWDENGDWLQPEPETSQALQRLLCRPMRHLWQDTPEARARAGNARWSPTVSEYRQANLKYPLQHAADGMLTTQPPAEAGELLEATAQLTTMGRCETGTMTLDRPPTRERQYGRVPMTVLEPTATLLSASLAPCDTTGGCNDYVEQQLQQQPEDRSSFRSSSGSGSWQQPTADQSQVVEQQVQQQAGPESMSRAANQIALKVVLSPQRPRTIISFENKTFSSDGPGTRPTLTMFPHTEGARVSKGLFTEYQLPNGRTAFMYYNSGTAMDEAEVPALWPPPRPTTVPLALQQSMPLAQVLGIMAKPPGSAPPYIPWKPVPRLVPLPGSHTLTVTRPELKDAASYGNLRPDNLQLSITAQAIMKSQTTTTEENIQVAVAAQREPWQLPNSIFKPRVKESDAKAFYDGGTTLDKMFERDWDRACAKEKFTSMLARENKGNAAGKSDKQALQEVHNMLKKYYQLFYSIFVYYAMGGTDSYHMPLNSFTSLLDDAGIPDPDSLSIKRSDCDTIFIVCNFQPDKNSPDVAVNDEHAMMRFEFMECVVRLALAKYGKGQSTDDLSVAVELLFERNLIPRMPPMAQLISNDFRTERLYTEEVDLLLKQHQNMLKSLYSRYRLKPSSGGLRPKALKLDGWLALMADAHLVDSQFTLADANLSFLWSRMFVVDEIKDYSRYICLTFVDFLEALGRVADAKSLPSASDLDAAGYPSILEWALDKERLEGVNVSNNASNNPGAAAPGNAAAAAAADAAAGRAAGAGGGDSAAASAGEPAAAGNPGGNLPEIFRPRLSARFGAPKPRPLYAKLELLLDLILRRLYWDPAQPETSFNYDALLRVVKKIDKDLGP